MRFLLDFLRKKYKFKEKGAIEGLRLKIEGEKSFNI